MSGDAIPRTWQHVIDACSAAKAAVCIGQHWQKEGDDRIATVDAVQDAHLNVVGVAASWPVGFPIVLIRIVRERDGSRRRATSTARADLFVKSFRRVVSLSPDGAGGGETT